MNKSIEQYNSALNGDHGGSMNNLADAETFSSRERLDLSTSAVRNQLLKALKMAFPGNQRFVMVCQQAEYFYLFFLELQLILFGAYELSTFSDLDLNIF